MLGSEEDERENRVDAIFKYGNKKVPSTAPPNRPARGGSPRGQYNTQTVITRPECSRCGYVHGRGVCPARDKECAGCHKVGHFVKVCRSKRTIAPVNEIYVDEHNILPEEISVSDGGETDLFVGVLGTDNNNKDLWYSDIEIDNVEIHFKLDTGSEAKHPTQRHLQ